MHTHTSITVSFSPRLFFGYSEAALSICVGQLSIIETTHQRQLAYEEKRFILVYSFGKGSTLLPYHSGIMG